MHVGIYLCSYVCTANISESTLGFFNDTFVAAPKISEYGFPRNVPFCGMWEIWVQFAPKLCNLTFALRIFYETPQHAGKQETKVMLILVSFSKKSSFCANVKFIDFEMTLRGRVFSPVGAMGNFAKGIFCWVVGIWQGVFLTI